jgi:hypothetical protein
MRLTPALKRAPIYDLRSSAWHCGQNKLVIHTCHPMQQRASGAGIHYACINVRHRPPQRPFCQARHRCVLLASSTYFVIFWQNTEFNSATLSCPPYDIFVSLSLPPYISLSLSHTHTHRQGHKTPQQNCRRQIWLTGSSIVFCLFQGW